MKSAHVLFQIGNKVLNKTTNTYYNPWENHIWTAIEQARKWSPSTEIYVILDDENVYGKENFERLNVKWERISDLVPRYDAESLGYWRDEDPSWTPIARAQLMKPFYMEQVIKKHDLKNIFSYDNDVMIYCDLGEMAEKMTRLYNRMALTAESETMLICAMMYIKDYASMLQVNDKFWEFMCNKDDQWSSYDMYLWKKVQVSLGDPYIAMLPIWMEGDYAKFWSYLGGIFDPISIGQLLGGSSNGHPPGTLFSNHIIAKMMLANKGRWNFGVESDKEGRRYFVIIDRNTGEKIKALSLHIHSKNLKNFKS